MAIRIISEKRFTTTTTEKSKSLHEESAVAVSGSYYHYKNTLSPCGNNIRGRKEGEISIMGTRCVVPGFEILFPFHAERISL